MAETTTKPENPHFFEPILPGLFQRTSIPKVFMLDYMVGENCDRRATLKTKRRETLKTWTASINGSYFTNGWKEFATQNDLRVGDILVFKHEGNLIFHVLVFDSTACERKYHTVQTDQAHDKEEGMIAAKDFSSGKETSASKQVAHAPTFTVTNKPCNFSWKALCIPIQFGREIGLVVGQTVGRVTLTDPKGKFWQVNLRWKQRSNAPYLGGGWLAFSAANKLKAGDDCTFKLVSKASDEIVMDVSVRRCSTTTSA